MYRIASMTMTNPSHVSDDDSQGSGGGRENENLVETAVVEKGNSLLKHREETTSTEEERDPSDSLLYATNKQADVEKGNDADDDDDSIVTESLTEDVYSLIYTVPWRSGAFFFSIFVFLFQMTIIALVLWDLLDHFNNDSNPLNVPPGTSPQVQAALALALLLAVATQGDLIAALVMLQQGYDSRVRDVCYSATKSKWLLSCFMQALAGVALLLTIFILCVQSSTVIGMMLNFAALAFISEIDDVAFMLAQHGFISDALEWEAKHAADLQVPVKKTSKVLRRVFFLVIYSGLMVGYGIIIHQQRSGKFLCQSVFVQFGDGFAPFASSFSGVYEQTDKLVNGKVTYLDRNSKQAMIGYCDKESAWTFTYWFEDDDDEWREDPCLWYAKSKETESFDVTTTSDSTWVIYLDGGVNVQAQPFQFFVLQCVDCNEGDRQEACSGNGQCVDGKCQCNQGYYGSACEFGEPCQIITVDARTNSFPENDFAEDELSDLYFALKDENGTLVTVYDRPVYVYEFPGVDWSVMLFTGRRWIVFSTLLFMFGQEVEPPTPADATLNELVAFLEKYHAAFNGVPGFFVSDPMDVGTPSNAFTPVGLGWYKTKSNSDEGFGASEIDSSQPIGTTILCAICDYVDETTDDKYDDDGYVENDCFFGGECTSEGFCNCTEGFEGALCELDTSLVTP